MKCRPNSDCNVNPTNLQLGVLFTHSISSLGKVCVYIICVYIYRGLAWFSHVKNSGKANEKDARFKKIGGHITKVYIYITNQFLEYLVWSHFRRHDHKASAFLGLLKLNSRAATGAGRVTQNQFHEPTKTWKMEERREKTWYSWDDHCDISWISS